MDVPQLRVPQLRALLADFLRSVRGMNPYITENTDAVRQEFEAIIETGWREPAILDMAATEVEKWRIAA